SDPNDVTRRNAGYGVAPSAFASLSEQRAVIAQDHLRGIVTGRAGDAAAGMGAGAAMVEALQRPAIVGMAEHRPRREQLIERQRAMKDVAAEQAELPLQIERRQYLAADHACRKARRVFVHRRDHEVGDLIAVIVPGLSVRQFRRDMLAEQARDVLAL